MATARTLPPFHDSVDTDLCQRCQAFDIQAFSRNTTPWRGYRISDIADSAASGCAFCSYLARSLDDAGIRLYSKKRDKVSRNRWIHFKALRAVQDVDHRAGQTNSGLNITYLQVHTGVPVGNDEMWFGRPPLLEFHVVADPGDTASISGDVVGRHVVRNTKSLELVDLMKTWLTTCVKEHTECSQTLSGQPITIPTPLPTRCLEVTGDDTALDGIYIRLVKTADRAGGYITLSHRWPAPPKKLLGATTSSNLADRVAGKEALESTLPRHFVDACRLTLQLGYQYIWIDAVCIVQGSNDEAKIDWAYEAARMASYYQNSRLTIAATYGDDDTGLFGTETVDSSRPLIRLPYRPKTAGMTSQPSFFYLVPSDRYSNDDYESRVVQSDLLSRGWVVQEWVLSRRILCFTPNTVYFQCSVNLPQNEDGKVITLRKSKEGEGFAVEPVEKVSNLELKDLNLKGEHRHWHWRNSIDKLWLNSIERHWLNIVQAYSKRNLTYPKKDKLVGIVGIAEEFGRALVRQHGLTALTSRLWVGGLWLHDIHAGLLWEQVHPLPASVPNSSSVAAWQDAGRIAEFPSWSWASRRCSIEFARSMRVDSKLYQTCEVTAVRDARVRRFEIATLPNPVAVDEADENLLPFLSSGPNQAYLVDPTKTFPLLELRAPIARILIRELFTDGEERKIASILSGHESSGRWRKVALPSSPQLISGWVSLERYQEHQEGNDIREPLRDDGAPDGQHMADDQVRTDDYSNAGERIELNVQQPEREPPTIMEERDPSEETQVLLVSYDVLEVKESGFALGLGKRYPIVYNFLCLRRYEGEGADHPNEFERIGVGKMFGREVERLFKNADKEDLWLF